MTTLSVGPIRHQSPRVQQALQDRLSGLWTLRRFFVENGLSVAMLGLFVVFAFAQTVAGMRAFNQELEEHNQIALTYFQYLFSSHCWEALAENWESEFLQMGAFVWMTSFLFQKGSPESQDPYEAEETEPVTEKSPWPARRGGWVRKVYEYSLSLAFLILFIGSFLLHAWAGAREFTREQAVHGEPGATMLEFMRTGEFWFQSLQNWQSEFLAIGAMVLLAVWLRQQGSPESKQVAVPHERNE
jgi:hypothetical protein